MSECIFRETPINQLALDPCDMAYLQLVHFADAATELWPFDYASGGMLGTSNFAGHSVCRTISLC